MTIVYEKTFDVNEWFVIISLITLSVLIWLTPKILSLLEGIAHFVYSIFMGMFYDHTISVKPWDYYDVNDSSAYQFIDFLSYVMYGPYSYFFIYLYVRLKIKGFIHIAYIIGWASLALFTEWIGTEIGLFHYDKGYKMYWSFPIYLLTITLHLAYYHFIKRSFSNKGENKMPRE
jgi:hypothetical protein